MGYAKLFSSITESSLWSEPKEVRLLFVSMLARCDANGFVEAAVPGLARLSNLSIEETQSAIAVLEGPDPHSKNPDNDGRRIVKVPGGWVLSNYAEYRNRPDDESRRAYMREYMKKYREKAGCKQQLTSVKTSKPRLTQATATATATGKDKNKGSRFAPPTLAEVQLYCAKAGISEADASWFYYKMEGQDWINGKREVKKWGMTLMAWKNAGYLPSQKIGQSFQHPTSKPMSDADKVRAAL